MRLVSPVYHWLLLPCPTLATPLLPAKHFCPHDAAPSATTGNVPVGENEVVPSRLPDANMCFHLGESTSAQRLTSDERLMVRASAVHTWQPCSPNFNASPEPVLPDQVSSAVKARL